MILVVEDSKNIAMTVRKQFANHVPDAEVVLVADAENAVKALSGEEFSEYVPDLDSISPRGPCKFTAALWDNHLPRTWGARAESDVGLEAVEALQSSEKVDHAVLSRFISHSSDDSDRFVDSGRFIRVFHKPMVVGQVREIGELLRLWDGKGRTSSDSDASESLEDKMQGIQFSGKMDGLQIDGEHSHFIDEDPKT